MFAIAERERCRASRDGRKGRNDKRTVTISGDTQTPGNLMSHPYERSRPGKKALQQDETGGLEESHGHGKEAVKKTFSIGASTIPGEFIIPRLLSQVARSLSDIDLRVVISDSFMTFKKVKAGLFEIGIVGTRYESDEIEYLPAVKEDRLVVISAPAHSLATKKVVTFSDLKGQDFISREAGSGTRDVYEKAFNDAGIPPGSLNIVLELADTEQIVRAVGMGVGLSVVSELAAAEPIRRGEVAVLNVPLLKLTRHFYIITRKIKPLSTEAKRVLTVLKMLMDKEER